MKKFIANISRITITYSKFLIMIMMLSSSGAPARAADALTYLKCGNHYLQLSGHYLYTNYNIRTKKFMRDYRISKYGEVIIRAGYYTLNRDTGAFSYSGKQKSICEKINFNQLPKLNAEGKKF